MNCLSFLEKTYPELFEFLSKANHFYVNNELSLSAYHLRIYGEKFLSTFCQNRQINIPAEINSQFEKLKFLEENYPDIFTSDILKKIHKIRKIGNAGAHGGNIPQRRLKDALDAGNFLIEDLKMEGNTETIPAEGQLVVLTIIAAVGGAVGGIWWLIKKALR